MFIEARRRRRRKAGDVGVGEYAGQILVGAGTLLVGWAGPFLLGERFDVGGWILRRALNVGGWAGL